MSYIFPISFFLNNFSMTILIVGLSLVKRPNMAADVGIVQGATVALFYAFSANGRNVILNPTSPVSVRTLFISRLLLVLPLGIIAYYLSVYGSRVEGLLAFVLILRRASEWICELYLSDMELRGLKRPAMIFSLLQLALLVLVLGWMVGHFPWFEIGLGLWALPLLLVGQYSFRDVMAAGKKIGSTWRYMVPHLGSTAIIGIAVYVFRLMIMLLVGRETAGDLYAAFAIGGILGSVYLNALGPSLTLHEVRRGKTYQPLLLKISLWICFIGGVIIVIAVELKHGIFNWSHKPYVFWEATGLSMIGGVLMVLAQRIRLRLLQLHQGQDVYGPDVLSNILIIGCIPYLFYIFGEGSLMGLFLFSAIFNLLFYYSGEMTTTSYYKIPKPVVDYSNKVVLVLLLFPLFFQLSGHIFADNAFVFDSAGMLKRLPIPISVVGCFLGILLLGRYRRAYLSLGVIFLTFVLMLTTSMLSTHGDPVAQKGKLLLLIQFILPMFALVLGQMYESNKRNVILFEKVFLYIIAGLVPVQLAFSLLQGSVVLTPYLYLFSVYQHVQYVACIFVCCYLIALFSLWQSPRYQKILVILAFFMGIYAVASMSIAALTALIVGVGCFTGYRWRLGKIDKPAVSVLCLAVVGILLYLPIVRDNGTVKVKFGFIGKIGTEATIGKIGTEATIGNLRKLEKVAPNVSERIYYWKYYSRKIMTDCSVFFLGHAERPSRAKIPSAHNYYMDFIYNFGFLAIIPFLAVIGYTLRMICRYRKEISTSAGLLGLAAVVLFLVLADNNLKVGLRQPYPGILTFFLWGILLSRLERLEAAKVKEAALLETSGSFEEDIVTSAML